MLRSFISATTTGEGVDSRRGFLKTLCTTAAAGAVTLSWRDLLVARAKELQKSGKRMILLWMDGGPSQYDTFNPKPGSEYQGPTQSIHTNVPGIDIGEHWPHTAKVFDKIALIRSMVSDEKDHFRAIKLVRTGYPIKPTIPYPTWGSVVVLNTCATDGPSVRRSPNTFSSLPGRVPARGFPSSGVGTSSTSFCRSWRSP